MPKQPQSHCLNCGYHFRGRAFPHCPRCGQKRDGRLTIGSVFENLMSSYFALDSRLANTFIPFFFKPGKVAYEYIKGKRKRYLSPSQTYFFFSFLFFFLLTTIYAKKWDASLINSIKLGVSDGLQMNFMVDGDTINVVEGAKLNAPKDSLKTSTFNSTQTKLTNANAATNPSDSIKTITQNDSTTTLPKQAQLEPELDSIFSEINPNYKEITALINEGKTNAEIYEAMYPNGPYEKYKRLDDYFQYNLFRNKGKGLLITFISQLAIGLFVLLALFSLVLWLLHIRRKFSLAEHFVHTVYFFSFLFALLIICIIGNLYLPSVWWWVGASAASLWYLLRSLRVVYEQPRWKSILKFLMLIFLTNAFILPVILIVVFLLSMIQYS